MRRPFLLLAISALTAGAAVAPGLPALAAPTQSTPVVGIAAKSLLPKVTGDVWVIWQGKKVNAATISGTVSGAVAGDVIRVFARQFPYQKQPAQVGQDIPVSSDPASYSVQVTPGLATHYQAELFSGGSTTPVAISPPVTVYVVSSGSERGVRNCARPVCHQTIRITMKLPASTMRTERAKRWYTYFGLHLGGAAQPSPPKYLKLGAGSPRVSKVRKLTNTTMALSVSFTFRIGSHGYYWLFTACAKDTESKDGLNLPGQHGCGTLKYIRSSRIYLG